MLRNMCFSESTQNFIEKSLKIIWLARISLFDKFLIKVVIYSLVFLWKGCTFLFIDLNLHFSEYWGKIPFLMLHLHTLIYNSFYGFWRYMVKRKFTFNFEFFFIAFILRWKANFLIMELIVPFPDEIEVSSSQLKRFKKSVIDPRCLLNIAATSFCLITF